MTDPDRADGDPPAGAAERAPAVLRMKNVLRVREGADVRFELHVPEAVIRRGSFVAIVGQSGCGKSTLLDMLGLVMRPTEGEAFQFHGDGAAGPTDVMELWRRRDETELARLRRLHIGYVLQTGGLFPFLSAAENIGLQAQLIGRALPPERIEADARRFAIGDILSKKPGLLSGGQRQRTAILRALSSDPTVVLADEPTAAVDEERAKQIFRDFNEMARQRGVTVIVVTHSPDLVEPYADVTFRFEVHVEGNVTTSYCREARP